MFSTDEKQDMYVYIRSNRNCTLASENYFTLYPERRQPNRVIFGRIARTLGMFSSFTKPRGPYERKQTVNDINVLAQIAVNPDNSSRKIAQECSIHDTTARKIIKKYKYRDYKFKPVQNLHPGDTQRRLEFCNWFSERQQEDQNFARKILWTDESQFTNAGIFNRKNRHYYATENPHLVREIRPQVRYSLNVWAGILNDFLQNRLEDALDEQPLGVIRYLEWFQHDGAGPHNAHVVRNYLDAGFPNAWIGTYGPVRWAPRSPCLTPLDYFLWGTIKDKVYSNATNNIEHLRVKIEDAFQSVSQNSVQKAVDQMELRTNLCIRYNEGHVEQYITK
ncbi:hypothetical protein NQ315_014408 [Exocentrus adspersus]|uniref:Transposase n=1 Tax=Exocentrus adspersus TaxID=1586481 RepID=A0AAV8VFA0_9CUCU|nr:hypothetical protein NQ315_014408 [Exocentrus adspersus]